VRLLSISEIDKIWIATFKLLFNDKNVRLAVTRS